MTNTEKRILYLQRFALLIQKATLEGIEVIETSGHRSDKEQNELYQKGRTTPGPIVTNCDGYFQRSKHQDWLAKDLLIVENGVPAWERAAGYDRLGEIWESLGGTWGGRFISPDCYHFEL